MFDQFLAGEMGIALLPLVKVTFMMRDTLARVLQCVCQIQMFT